MARYHAVVKSLDRDSFAALDRVEAPRAALDDLSRVHPRAYVEQVLGHIPDDGYGMIDVDTIVSPASGEASLRAAGAVCAAVDDVVSGDGTNAFCAVRPPGHHAEPGRAMGFCLFNNIAVGALHARAKHGLERVAVVDFDVHHGNGTQARFWDDRDAFFGSTHQYPFYPGTGRISETGAGNIFNAPLTAGDGSSAFRAAMDERVLPALDAFAPEIVLVSAGFDAHRDDPLGGLNLIEADFAWITQRLMEIADRHAGGRVVSALEGGYNLPALAACAAAHVGVLMEAP